MKWIEAVSYSLETNPNPELESIVDAVIDIIERAQQPDGYLDTFYIIMSPGKDGRICTKDMNYMLQGT